MYRSDLDEEGNDTSITGTYLDEPSARSHVEDMRMRFAGCDMVIPYEAC